MVQGNDSLIGMLVEKSILLPKIVVMNLGEINECVIGLGLRGIDL